MGIFGKPVDLDEARPLSLERIASCLKELGYSAGEDDGALYGSWPSFQAKFGASGKQHDLLAMSAAWIFRPPSESHDALCLAANEWAAAHYWPNLNVIRLEEFCRVDADLVFDTEPAVTDAFIKQQIRCFLGTTVEAYDWIAEQFPDHVLWLNVRAE